jgi:hypothetical protein
MALLVLLGGDRRAQLLAPGQLRYIFPPRQCTTPSPQAALPQLLGPVVDLGGPIPLAAPPLVALAVEQRPPSYRLSREVKTVEGLWREWTMGFPGLPSVEELNLRWGSEWRVGKERQYYSTRLRIIEEVRKRGIAMGDIERRVRSSEGQRVAAGVSLDNLQKILKVSSG